MKIPGPSDLLRMAGDGYEAIEQAIGLAPKAGELVGQTVHLIKRAGALLDAADQVLATASDLLARSDKVLQRIDSTSTRAAALVDQLEPSLTALTPVLNTFVDTTSPSEVAHLTLLVDQLPEIATAVRDDVLPVFKTLETVGPDLSDLLMLSRELNEILGAIPGLGRAKRRIEEERAEQDAADDDQAQPDEK